MRQFCVDDIEVLPNCFICCCKVIGEKNRSFEISERKNQLQEMYDFFTSGKYTFVGYNSNEYDTPILNMIFSRLEEFLKKGYRSVCDAAKQLSDLIVIHRDMFAASRYKYLGFFKSVDLMTMMASKALRVGLKSLQVTMCYTNVKEMVIDWSKDIEPGLIDEVVRYCFNDIDSTRELLGLLKTDLQLRINIQREYKIKCLSKDGVGIGVDIFTNAVCKKLQCDPKQLPNYVELPEKIVVGKYIEPLIAFKTPELQELLEWYKNMELAIEQDDGTRSEGDLKTEFESKYDRMVQIGKLHHNFALGGVHSVNKPTVYTSDSEWFFIDEDVESYYPSLVDIYGYGPIGFQKEFQEVIHDFKQERVIAKKNGDKLKNEVYKLALNSILGHLRNRYGPYFAPQANVAICVNGQLMIAMLIETCELEGIECVSSNTDGATFKVHKSKLELFQQICNEWSELTNMKLEDTIYEKMVIYAVNDYIAYKTGYKSVQQLRDCLDGKAECPEGYSDIKHKLEFLDPYTAIHNPKHPMLELQNTYVKEKGMFITVPRLGKGLDSLIVPKALQNYFGKGIPISETIQGSKSIWDFIKFQKIGRDFDVVWNEQKQQHINRFYVSKKGAYLYKQKFVEKFDSKQKKMTNVKSMQNVLKGYGVQLMNEFSERPMTEYDIQYNYYMKQANEIIRDLEPQQLQLF